LVIHVLLFAPFPGVPAQKACQPTPRRVMHFLCKKEEAEVFVAELPDLAFLQLFFPVNPLLKLAQILCNLAKGIEDPSVALLDLDRDSS